jgi:undecaprenyl pyrophosphate phosphatase UppP
MAGVFAVGWMAAFVSGIAAIGLVLRLVDRHRFRWLGFYCLLAAGLFGAWLASRAG